MCFLILTLFSGIIEKKACVKFWHEWYSYTCSFGIWVYKTDTSYLPRFQHNFSTESSFHLHADDEHFSNSSWYTDFLPNIYSIFYIQRFFVHSSWFCCLNDEFFEPQNSHNLAAAILVIFYTVCTVYRLYIGTLICFNRYIFDLSGSPVFQNFYISNTDYN